MRTFSITDMGMVRQVNQDYVYATDNPLGILQNLFVVADGMGGHQAGDYASKYTVEVLKRELAMSEGEDIEKCLVKAIKTANREIIKEASRDAHLKGMGTTVVVAALSRKRQNTIRIRISSQGRSARKPTWTWISMSTV